jgi:hypothetical protein
MSDPALLTMFSNIPRNGYDFKTVIDVNNDMWLLLNHARRLLGRLQPSFEDSHPHSPQSINAKKNTCPGIIQDSASLGPSQILPYMAPIDGQQSNAEATDLNPEIRDIDTGEGEGDMEPCNNSEWSSSTSPRTVETRSLEDGDGGGSMRTLSSLPKSSPPFSSPW